MNLLESKSNELVALKCSNETKRRLATSMNFGAANEILKFFSKTLKDIRTKSN